MKSSQIRALALAFLVAGFPTCGGEPRQASAPPAAASESDQVVPPDEAEIGAGGDSSTPKPPPLTPLGVPECDKFVDKYIACVDLHVPAEQKEGVMRELHVHRARWRELQRMQDGKLAAGLSCRGVAQRLKGDLIVDYGCEF